MKKLRLGILSPSEIALRRFMPALLKSEEFEFAGVAAAEKSEWFGEFSDEAANADKQKAAAFVSKYEGKLFRGYRELIESASVDCVYVPLPPALHHAWGMEALNNGKHVLLEKPFTTCAADTRALIALAKAKSLAVHENYMFVYHNQIDFILNQIRDGAIGELRLIRLDFTFPFRGASDFRYSKELGGGALSDCGGYPVKLASVLLGETARIVHASLSGKNGFDVDIYGSAVLENKDGLTAQMSFGMDNNYLCRIEIFGSGGSISTNRVFTSPDDFSPIIKVNTGSQERETVINPDNAFAKSIKHFFNCITDSNIRNENYNKIIKQSELVDSIREKRNK